MNRQELTIGRITSEWLCPFCGERPSGDERVVHCSNLGCPLNRVDFTTEQWRNRPSEEALICDNDQLRDTLSKQSRVVVDIGQRLRMLQEHMREEKEKRRIAWMKKRHAALRAETSHMRRVGG